MTDQEQLHLAKDIATQAHAGQVDRSGVPYINHPKKVASLVKTDEEKTVAWLHDVVEDTDITLNDLKAKGFADSIIEAISFMTHDSNVDYFDYVRNIKKNKLALAVKKADLTHNMDISRIKNPTKHDYERLNKYEKAIEILTHEEDAI